MREVIQIICDDGTDARIATLQKLLHACEKSVGLFSQPRDFRSIKRGTKLIVFLSKRLLDDIYIVDYLDTKAHEDVLFILTDERFVPIGFVAPILDWRSGVGERQDRMRLEWIESWVLERALPRRPFAATTAEGLTERAQRRRVYAAHEPVFSALSGAVGLLTVPFITYAELAISRFRVAENDDFFFGSLLNLAGLGFISLIPTGIVYFIEYSSLALSWRRQYLPIRQLEVWIWTTIRFCMAVAAGVSVTFFIELPASTKAAAQYAGLGPVYVVNTIVYAMVSYVLYGAGMVLFRLGPLVQRWLNTEKVFSLLLAR